MTSSLLTCDVTTDCLPPIEHGECLGLVPLEITKKCKKKCICVPVIRGPEGHPGPEGPMGEETLVDISVNNTCFVDPQYGDDLTGTIERMDLPFASLSAAISAIPIGAEGGIWQIYLWPGSYTDNITVNQANIQVDLRGSGVNSTVVNGRILIGAGLDNIVLTVANLTLNNTGNQRAIEIVDGLTNSMVRIRDSTIISTVTEDNSELIYKGTGVGFDLGEISIIDCSLTYNSTAPSATTVVNQSGILRLASNQFNFNLSGSGAIFSSVGGLLIEVSDSLLNCTFEDQDLDFYALDAGLAIFPSLLLINDNRHLLTPSNSYTGTLQIYRATGMVAPETRISARNNEYSLVGDFSGATVHSASNVGSTGPIKIVDDTYPDQRPLFAPVPSTSVDPNATAPIQYQINTGNSLATNQGIQFATREITSSHTVNDDDFFILYLGGGGDTITFPTPSTPNRGKIVIVRNESGGPSVTIAGVTNLASLADTEAAQIVNDGQGGDWLAFAGVP